MDTGTTPTDSTLTVAGLTAWLRAYATLITRHEDELTELDAAIGDADHGTNMARGMKSVTALLADRTFETLDALAKQTGMALVSSVGGASGPLYGTFWIRFARPLAGLAEADAEELGRALHAAVEGVRQRGKAEAGDKTMLDALLPALDAYDTALAEGAGLSTALARAADAAEAGCAATIPLVAHKGRASYLGERSAGHQDPGATSAALLLRAATR
ncbi:dihydroxyacetone kinase subunit DhaL [Raineyella sp. LH-20]|uniref:dihydroxyacetone kinase subunit DhaL n=1 Tax=Raineyella sp. LH-20 TaxID=3081204 RepID=UPI002955B535|nr:dihydroxyacetone kinase subunit DhaL [Raineyella sp. LH-20]WOP20185.1 dihydroxyacetone kinase subunit DhaL [Raineyella sp. LH-20]